MIGGVDLLYSIAVVDTPPQFEPLVQLIRRELAAISARIADVKTAIQGLMKVVRTAEERKRQQEPPPDKPKEVRAIVSFDEETVRDSSGEHERQYRTQRSIRNATWAAFIAASIYALIAACQTYELRKAAEAAQRSANFAQRQLEITDRPWISVEATSNTEWVPNALIGGPLIFDASGRGSLTVELTLRNIGRSVATDVYVRQEVIATSIDAASLRIPIDEQKRICGGQNTYAGSKSAYMTDPRYTIFPNDYQIEFSKSTFDTHNLVDTLPGLKRGKPVIPYLLGCVDYEYGSLSVNHQTGFIYEVLGGRDHQGIQTSDSVPVNKLTFEPYTFGGKYAY